MIAFLDGKLVHCEPTFIHVDVNGVGYHLHISLQTFADLKNQERVRVYTHLAIREDAHVLYGFSTVPERKLFQLLISVNGVGPNTAIVMLSYLNTSELKTAIIREDVMALQAVKGIGGKTAQRVIIELRDKLKKESLEDGTSILTGAHNTLRREALSALLTLGLPKAAAEKSVDAVLKKSGNTITLEDLVKQALKNA